MAATAVFARCWVLRAPVYPKYDRTRKTSTSVDGKVARIVRATGSRALSEDIRYATVRTLSTYRI
eukprot:SAG31_NODE_7623_length_1637_cov_1.046164_2_plen_65_part_00